MVQRHSTVSYGLKRIWPANINVDNIASAVYHPPATRQASLFDKSASKLDHLSECVCVNICSFKFSIECYCLPHRRVDVATHTWPHVSSL